MAHYVDPDRYCRVCNTLLSHLESGVCLVHERRDIQIADIARTEPHPWTTGDGTPIAEAFRDGAAHLRAHYASLTRDTPKDPK